MPETNELMPSEQIVENKILLIRGQRVLLAPDLAALYGVTPKRLHEQVRRNRKRFPEDFMFQLTIEERDELAAKCGQFRNIKHSRVLPYAFSEHGALMLANVLNSERAVEVSIFVTRAFVRLRKMLGTHKDLARKLDELEKHIQDHDGHIQTLFEAIRELMKPDPVKDRKIGFLQE
jgi:ORF6N domain-containing protein